MSDVRNIRNIRAEDKARYAEPRERWPDEPFRQRCSWQVCEDCGYRAATALVSGRWLCGDRECEGKRDDRPPGPGRGGITLAERRQRAIERLKGEIDASN